MNGYKTYLASGLLALFGVLVQVDWVRFLDDPKSGYVAIASAILMAVMRAWTEQTTVKQALNTEPPKKVSK
jgi:hypothetical protein